MGFVLHLVLEIYNPSIVGQENLRTEGELVQNCVRTRYNRGHNILRL